MLDDVLITFRFWIGFRDLYEMLNEVGDEVDDAD